MSEHAKRSCTQQDTCRSCKCFGDKKWFTQPSLPAQAGSIVDKLNFTKYDYLGFQPLAEVTIRMETATTLLLRKILDPAKPAHQAILEQSASLEAAAEGLDQSAAFLPKTPNLRDAGRQPRGDLVALGRGLKRPHDINQAGSVQIVKVETAESRKRARAMAQSEIIDLT